MTKRLTPFHRRLVPGIVLLSCAALMAPAAKAQLDPGRGVLLIQGFDNIPGPGVTEDQLGEALAVGDFDHDGRFDLAIGVAGKDAAPSSNNGMVIVVYGDSDGLASGEVESWDGGDFAALGLVAGDGDRFGQALAAGDFDGDGFDDLAIGAPGTEVERPDGTLHDGAGAVLVLYGAPGGLSTAGQQAWWQGRDGLAGLAEVDDRLGETLAVGDLDGDGFVDLAAGVPYEDVGAVVDAGGVNVLYGSLAGLTTATQPNLVWTQTSFSPTGEEVDDRFGSALAMGDFWGDGADDLVIGAPDEDLVGAPGAGAVTVARGLLGSGLSAAGATLLTRGSIFVGGGTGVGDRFGAAFAVGDLDGDGAEDLAIGAPGEVFDDGVTVHLQVGAVHVLRGQPGEGVGTHWFGTRIARSALGSVTGLESFGAAIVAADFDHDGVDELVVGSPGDTVDGAVGAGVAYLVGQAAASPVGAVLPLRQGDGAPQAPHAFDGLGSALVAADFDGNRYPDLAVGVPFENHGMASNAGAVMAFPSRGIFRDDFETGNAILWSESVGE